MLLFEDVFWLLRNKFSAIDTVRVKMKKLPEEHISLTAAAL